LTVFTLNAVWAARFFRFQAKPIMRVAVEPPNVGINPSERAARNGRLHAVLGGFWGWETIDGITSEQSSYNPSNQKAGKQLIDCSSKNQWANTR
jgi:hypothetical protein